MCASALHLTMVPRGRWHHARDCVRCANAPSALAGSVHPHATSAALSAIANHRCSERVVVDALHAALRLLAIVVVHTPAVPLHQRYRLSLHVDTGACARRARRRAPCTSCGCSACGRAARGGGIPSCSSARASSAPPCFVGLRWLHVARSSEGAQCAPVLCCSALLACRSVWRGCPVRPCASVSSVCVSTWADHTFRHACQRGRAARPCAVPVCAVGAMLVMGARSLPVCPRLQHSRCHQSWPHTMLHDNCGTPSANAQIALCHGRSCLQT